MSTMPNVVGLNISEATVALIQAGIVPDNGLLPSGNFNILGYFAQWPITLTWFKKPGTVPGIVTAQQPLAGSIGVALGDSIAFEVADFPFSVADRWSAGAYDAPAPIFYFEYDLLLENGYTFLLETGGNILLEVQQ